MADNGSGGGGTTQIIVALIGVIGVVGAALFANWDKIFPADRAPSAVLSSPASDPPPRSATDDVPVVATAATIDISGAWHDDDGYGYGYFIAQRGGRFTYRQFRQGAEIGGGTGKILGRSLSYQFSSGADRGICEAEVEPGERALAGRCSSGAVSWPFRVVRSNI